MEQQFKAEQPIRCDCGHIYKISVIGLDEDTVLSCPSCNDSYSLDWEVVEEIQENFVEMLAEKLAEAGIDWDDDAILRFAQKHGRIPKPGEDYSEFQW